MRRIVILTAAFVMCLQSYGQLHPGDFMLGGNLSFSRQRGQTPDNAAGGITTQTGLKFRPSIGMFFTKRLAFGFSTNVDYSGSSYSYFLKDSIGKEFTAKDQYFELTFGFGMFTSYYYPLCENLYWVNTVNVSWGTFTRGDRVASLFSADKPKQDKEKFVIAGLTTGLQYFVRPNLAVSMSIDPLSLSYYYKRMVRDNQPISKTNSTIFQYSNIAKGFTIGVRYLIIADNEERK